MNKFFFNQVFFIYVLYYTSVIYSDIIKEIKMQEKKLKVFIRRRYFKKKILAVKFKNFTAKILRFFKVAYIENGKYCKLFRYLFYSF